MAKYKVVSTDAHVNIPIEELKDRVDEDFWRNIPQLRMQMDPDSEEARQSRRRFRTHGELTEDDIERNRAGGWDPELRIKDQERDGVIAEIMFGPLGFDDPNPEVDRVVHRAFNDWAGEVFAPYSDRLSVSAGLPVADPKLAADEVQRLAKQGFRHVFMPCIPPNESYNRKSYDPVWAALSDTGLVANFHIGTGHYQAIEKGPGGPMINFLLGAQIDAVNVAAYLCAGGVCHRFPKLKWATIEGDAGWVPWALGALDHSYEKHHFWLRENDVMDMKPSEYFRRQGHVNIMDDRPAILLREEIGVENLMFGTDYPHHEGTFPHTQEVIERTFEGVPENEVRMIVGENAARLYGLSV